MLSVLLHWWVASSTYLLLVAASHLEPSSVLLVHTDAIASRRGTFAPDNLTRYPGELEAQFDDLKDLTARLQQADRNDKRLVQHFEIDWYNTSIHSWSLITILRRHGQQYDYVSRYCGSHPTSPEELNQRRLLGFAIEVLSVAVCGVSSLE